MDTTLSLTDSTSDLCTTLLDNVRSVRCSTARFAYNLNKAGDTNSLYQSLRSFTRSLHLCEKDLIHLSNEIERSLSLNDLYDLANNIVQEIFLVKDSLSQRDPRESDKYGGLLDLPNDIRKLYVQANELLEACIQLDMLNCPPAPPLSSDDDDIDYEFTIGELTILPRALATWESSIPTSAYTLLLAQLHTKISSDGRQCFVCYEEMTSSKNPGIPVMTEDDDDDHCPAITLCGHVFGKDCIERAVEEQGKCPMCRKEIPDVGYLLYNPIA